MNKKLNIIPIIKDSKKPSIKWLEYREKKFPINELHLYEPSNKAVICGKTSNNLVIIDFDFKNKPVFRNIIKSLKTGFPEEAKTMIVTTPNGLHIYFFILGECPKRQTQICSPFEEVEHVDILGEGGYALIPPSMIGEKYYLAINNYQPKTITREKFDKIIASFTTTEEVKEKIEVVRAKKKPLVIKRFRTPYQWILKGDISVRLTANKTGMDIKDYWRGLYAEAVILGYEPKQLFAILAQNQSDSFNFKTAKYQVEYAEENGLLDKPSTTRTLKKLFPTYTGMEREIWIDIAEELKAKFDIVAMSDSKKLMIKKGNIYTDKTDNFFMTLDRKTIDRAQGKKYDFIKKTILSHIKDANRFDRDRFCYDKHIIPFLNGYLNLKANSFKRAEDSKLIFCYVIPHEWKIGHYDCPRFKELLGQWLHGNGKIIQDDIFEMIGYTMTMDVGQRKAFFILGPTTTGKTSFQNILETVIGKDNRIGTPIQHFGADKFSMDNMENKVLNMVGDMSGSAIEDTSYFKLIAGGDARLWAEIKGGGKYGFNNITKIWYNANSLPTLKDKSDEAFYLRWIIIQFLNRFPTEVEGAVTNIDKDVTKSTNEIQGILHEAKKGIIRLRKRGFFRPEIMEETEHVWHYNSDYMYAFIYDNCVVDDDEMVEALDFHKTFNKWLFKKHKRRLSPYKIKERLEEHGIFKERSGSSDEYGKRPEYYDGIGWKAEEREMETRKF